MLNCTVVGDPLPTISWYIGGVDLSLSNMAPFDQEGRIDDRLTTTITILNTTTVMNSLAINETIPFLAEDYMCVASNSLGSVNRSATLTVQGEVQCLHLICSSNGLHSYVNHVNNTVEISISI